MFIGIVTNLVLDGVRGLLDSLLGIIVPFYCWLYYTL